jgi:glutamate synthase (NADPH) small chain
MNTLPLKERMKIPKQKMPEQAPNIRNRNFFEVNLGLAEEQAKLEAMRCLQCENQPCSTGCPVNVQIRDFIAAINDADYSKAVIIYKEDNILPAICGRVCPQEVQCESKCIVGKRGEPVAIGRLIRFATDWEREHNIVRVAEKGLPTGKKVAIVGSGPSGLTCAGDLIRKGHDVTIFEALHEFGGVLVYGIPEFRLPKKIVNEEVLALEKLGVKFVRDFVVGFTETIDELFEEGFDAVFIGVGAGLPHFLNIPGENSIGILSSNEFLTRVNLMKAFRFPEYDTPVISCQDKNVAVFGGGNTAMDSVRTSLRLGAKNAYIIYRRSENELPARAEEVHHAREEGVQFLFLNAPTEFLANEQGRVQGVKLQKMALGEPDASGRCRPVPIEGSEYILDIDLAIVAIGNGSNPIIQQTTPDLQFSRWGTIIVNEETMETNRKAVYAGGDIVSGGATVILAMGAGRKAASAIDTYFSTLDKNNGKNK